MTATVLTPAHPPPYASARAWERFTAKVLPTRAHALWLGAIASDGYGRFHDPDYADEDLPAGQRSGIVRVSRWIWWAWHGPIPSRLVVMHRCDLPICVRLQCLALGTQAQNLAMAAARDRVVRRGAGGRLDHADARGQGAQSRDIRAAARAAVASGMSAAEVDAVIADAVYAGDPYRLQLPLFAMSAAAG